MRPLVLRYTFACMTVLCIFEHALVRAESITVNFVNLPPITTSMPTLTTSDSSQPDLGTGNVFASMPGGLIMAELTAAPPSATTGGSYSLRAAINDEFTYFGPATTLSAMLTVTGTGLAPFLDSDTPEPGGQSSGHVVGFLGSGAEAFSFTTNPGSTHVDPDIPFPIAMLVSDVFPVVDGMVFSKLYGVILLGANGTDLDVFHTVQLSFHLPPGASINSVGGYSQRASVPEPSPFSVLAMAAIGLLVGAPALKRSGSAGRMPIL